MSGQVQSPPRAVRRARRWDWHALVGERAMTLISPIALLVIWEICAKQGWIDTRFFPAPSDIFHKLVEMLKSRELLENIWASLRRLFWGCVIGGIPALLLGIVMGLSKPVRVIFEPLIAATYPIPKSSILPLALLIFGLGESSKVFMVALGVFFPVAMNATTGVLQIEKIYMDVGRNFNASKWQFFTTIALPGAMPLILTGIRIGIGMGLVLIAVAEMMGAKSGLGFMIWNAWEIFDVEQMYVGLLVIALIGFLLATVIRELEHVLVPWKRH